MAFANVPLLNSKTGYDWKFFRAGGLDQVRVESGADLLALPELDQKLWVALSCPTRGLEFDSKTLELIDTDKDGRIRIPEILAAVKWANELLKNPGDLAKGGDALPLSAINDQTEAGRQLLASARHILASLGKSGATTISIEDTTDTARIFVQTKFNGDGIVPPTSAPDEVTQLVIDDIIATVGGEGDRSGVLGVSLAKVTQFFTELEAYSDWCLKAKADPAVLPFGDATGAAFDALNAVRSKIDDYFARGQLASFDARAVGPLNRAETEFVAFAAKNLATYGEDVIGLPLSRVEAGRALPLTEGLNPAWAKLIAVLVRDVVTPVYGAGKATLSEAEWGTVVDKFAAYEAWLGGKPVTLIETLGIDRSNAIRAGTSKVVIEQLIAEDVKLEAESNQIASVDRLIRYYRDLHTLLHNFVNFSNFYRPAQQAVFQTGRLYLDGRACDLCFSIDDIGKHSTLAANGRIYLAYCELTRPASNQKRLICAAFTAGFAETIWVGRNGIFYDRVGNDWDAVVVKVVEHSISLKEAFWSPWKKLAKMISDQVNKLLAAREQAALAAAGKEVDQLGKTVDSGKPPAVPAPAPAANQMGGAALASSVAAIGIAVGLISQALTSLIAAKLNTFSIITGVFGVILAISGPSVIIAYFKLRARDLGPILNACGWAINGRIQLTLKLGDVLTQEAEVPVGAGIQLTDPYADDNRKRNSIIALVIILAIWGLIWRYGALDEVLPQGFKAKTVFGANEWPWREPALTKSDRTK